MKGKKRHILIKGTVWPYDIIVTLGTTQRQFLDYVGKNFVNALSKDDIESLEFIKKGRTVRLENNAIVLWLKEYPSSPEWFGHLAHEIFHAADMILEQAGVTHTNDSDEVWAYLIDWITKEIYTQFQLL